MKTNFLLYYLILLLITFVGGAVPLVSKHWHGRYIGLLLTFSAAFLLGITLLHLMPDGVARLGHYAGMLMLAGFFAQQIIQRYTHGLEHGHHHARVEHDGTHGHHGMIWPVFIGLVIHAFSEGLPLGISYADTTTLPSLVLAIGLHKVPEVILVVTLFLADGKSKLECFLWLVLFSLLTPLSAFVAHVLGSNFSVAQTILHWCIPLVAGVFIQISTTIFYENASKAHEFKWLKWLMIALGIGISLLSLL
ncbi:MAG TPA: ZIP family metal transporter [Edaphocola sp.]|nr:ZIP family metal transporter [Edaphocola sp.]